MSISILQSLLLPVSQSLEQTTRRSRITVNNMKIFNAFVAVILFINKTKVTINERESQEEYIEETKKAPILQKGLTFNLT